MVPSIDVQTQQHIADLEKRLFEPTLSVTEVDKLLGELQQPALRAAAVKKLSEQAQGHIDKITAFAHDWAWRNLGDYCRQQLK